MLLLLGFLHEAGAASYGSFPAPDGSLTYTDVQDSSGRLDTPVATVGGLDFPDMSVSDACGPCPGDFSNTTESLNLALDASPGFGFDRIVITQGGQLNASAAGTDGAIAAVLSSVFIDIFEIDGAPIDKISASAPMFFRPCGRPGGDADRGLRVRRQRRQPRHARRSRVAGRNRDRPCGHPRDERGAGVGHARWNRLLDVPVVVLRRGRERSRERRGCCWSHRASFRRRGPPC